MAKNVTTIPATRNRFTADPISSRKKRRVAGYARVSTDMEDQQTSYAAQCDYYTNYMEYIVTPVIFRSSRIAEELAASAESRGISNPGVHSCRRKLLFRKRDWIMCVAAIAVTVMYFVLERTVAV